MNKNTTHLTLRSAAATAVSGALIAMTMPSAVAHVTVQADTTISGEYAALTFRVPNESDSASTNKLVVTLPKDKPLASVSVRPVPGWTADVDTKKLPKPVESNNMTIKEAPRTITWTADSEDAAIAPGEYQEFSISGGPLPEPGTLALPAEQTYSDGEVVSWDDGSTEGGQEPEHPAPAVEVTEADGGGSAEDEGGGSRASSAVAAPAEDSSDTVARVLGGIGIVVAVGATGVAVLGRRSRG